MNEEGKAFCRLQARRFADAKLGTPDFSRTQIVERAVRLGVEAKAFDLELPLHDPLELTIDLEQVAIATLKQDILRGMNNG